MSQVLVTEQYLDDIADAIRSKNGSESTYTPAQMAGAIVDIHTADEVVLVQKTVNANGQYNASDDSVDGYSGVRVNVPNTYSALDEGKVVSSGALVGQTSRNVTMNGTYDTTENNQVVVNVPSGGGGSANILHGTTDPTSQDGSDGSIYIKHIEIGTLPTNLLANYQNIDLWTKNKAAFTTHTVQYTDGVSRLTHKGGNGYERIFVPVDVESNTDYTFILQFYPETNVSYGYGAGLVMAISQEDQTNTGSSGTYNNLGKKDLSRTSATDFSTYYINFNSGSYTRIYAIIDLNIQDNQQNVLVFRKIYLMKGTYTNLLVPGEIVNVLLRKDGSWDNLIGSNIEDVNLG